MSAITSIQTVYIGKIEKIPLCPNTRCFTCDKEPKYDTTNNCAICPICGPDGTGIECPAYKCSSCTKCQLWDKNGCRVCSPCKPEKCPVCPKILPVCNGKCEKLVTPILADGCKGCPICQRQEPCICPQILCVDVGTCGQCSQLEPTTIGSNCPGCSQCVLQTPKDTCPQVRCAQPKCASYVNYRDGNCCSNCNYECQKSDDCPILYCDRCPIGTKTVNHYDDNGCIIACPTCNKQ